MQQKEPESATPADWVHVCEEEHKGGWGRATYGRYIRSQTIFGVRGAYTFQFFLAGDDDTDACRLNHLLRGIRACYQQKGQKRM